MWLFDKAMKRLVRRGTVTVTDFDGSTWLYGHAEAGWPDIALRFTEKGAADRLVRSPRLGLAEAFMDGRLVIERGDIMELVTLVRRNNPWEKGGRLETSSPLSAAVKYTVSKWARFNARAAARRNVAHHYDLDDGLYDLFLDAERQYSCAYWTAETQTLDEAQRAKMAHIAAKLALEPGMRVLDIGSGWGGLAIYLHKVAGVDVTGITLSTEQLGFAQARAEREGVADHVRFELIDYRDVAGRFDRIVSIGMFEHVGVYNYKQFFRQCHDLLTDDGVMLLHTIGRFGRPKATDAFTLKYTFPGAHVPALSELIDASEGQRLIVTDIETLRLHYARTLRAWYANCVANKDAIVGLYDERFYRLWTFYLAGACSGFENGGTCNYQIQYARDRRTLPPTRDYIGERERGYAG